MGRHPSPAAEPPLTIVVTGSRSAYGRRSTSFETRAELSGAAQQTEVSLGGHAKESGVSSQTNRSKSPSRRPMVPNARPRSASRVARLDVSTNVLRDAGRLFRPVSAGLRILADCRRWFTSSSGATHVWPNACPLTPTRRRRALVSHCPDRDPLWNAGLGRWQPDPRRCSSPVGGPLLGGCLSNTHPSPGPRAPHDRAITLKAKSCRTVDASRCSRGSADDHTTESRNLLKSPCCWPVGIRYRVAFTAKLVLQAATARARRISPL